VDATGLVMRRVLRWVRVVVDFGVDCGAALVTAFGAVFGAAVLVLVRAVAMLTHTSYQ
jgi:hypothetical protein